MFLEEFRARVCQGASILDVFQELPRIDELRINVLQVALKTTPHSRRRSYVTYECLDCHETYTRTIYYLRDRILEGRRPCKTCYVVREVEKTRIRRLTEAEVSRHFREKREQEASTEARMQDADLFNRCIKSASLPPRHPANLAWRK